jgi:hypothetical protein
MLCATVQVRGVPREFAVLLPRGAATVGDLKAAIVGAEGFLLPELTITPGGSPDATDVLADGHDLAAAAAAAAAAAPRAFDAAHITLSLFLNGASATPMQVAEAAARVAAAKAATEQQLRAANAAQEEQIAAQQQQIAALQQQLANAVNAIAQARADARAQARAQGAAELAEHQQQVAVLQQQLAGAENAITTLEGCTFASGRCFGRWCAPVPAIAAQVTRHDVNWGAEGARRHAYLQLTHDGSGLRWQRSETAVLGAGAGGNRWANREWYSAQGPVGVTSGRHYFQMRITVPGRIFVGWVDNKLSVVPSDDHWVMNDRVGMSGTHSSGAAYWLELDYGGFWFGTAHIVGRGDAPANKRPCVVGCLLDLDATPARMTVFVDGEPLAVQCPYDFPTDGRAWFPTVSLGDQRTALHSCAM